MKRLKLPTGAAVEYDEEPAAPAAPPAYARQALPQGATVEFDDEMPANQMPEVGKLESFGRGAAQGASLGFGDELVGVASALFGDKDYAGQRYKTARDENREKNAAAQAANPWSYGAGELGGSVATSFVPGLGVAGAGAKLGKAALQAGKVGAISGLGHSEAEDVGGLAKDALASGALSAVTGAAVGKIVGGAPTRAVQRRLGDVTGGATATMRDRLVGPAGSKVDDALTVLREKPFRKAGSEPGKLLQATEDAMEETGSRLDEIYAKAGARAGIRVADVLKQVDDIAASLAKDPGKADLARAVRAKADDIRAAWLPAAEKAPKVRAPKPVAVKPEPVPEMVQESLPFPGAKEIKRIKQGEGGRFEKADPIPGYDATPGPGAYQATMPFGDKSGWLRTSSGKDIGATVPNIRSEPTVTAQQVRVLASDIADAAFRGSPAVAPKAGQATSRQIWGVLKDLIGKNVDEAGASSAELKALNQRMSTLMNMREAVRYRATREATESTRLKDVMGKSADVALLAYDPVTFAGKKGLEYLGKPLARAADDRLADIVNRARAGEPVARLKERAIMMGLGPVAAQAMATWAQRTASQLSGGYQANEAPAAP